MVCVSECDYYDKYLRMKYDTTIVRMRETNEGCSWNERERESILKAQVRGVSMRLKRCIDADDLLLCSATVGNLGELGEPDILT